MCGGGNTSKDARIHFREPAVASRFARKVFVYVVSAKADAHQMPEMMQKYEQDTKLPHICISAGEPKCNIKDGAIAVHIKS